jgi:hypothetical protein
MGRSDEKREQLHGVLRIARFAEYVFPSDDDRVRAEDRTGGIAWKAHRDIEAFLLREAGGEVLGGFALPSLFVHAGDDDFESDLGIAENFGPTRGPAGENETRKRGRSG